MPPASTLNSSMASVEGVMEVEPSSYSVISKPSSSHPAASRELPLMRSPMRDARIPVPPEAMSEPPGVYTAPGVNWASCQNARPFRGILAMATFSTTCPTDGSSVTSTGDEAST